MNQMSSAWMGFLIWMKNKRNKFVLIASHEIVAIDFYIRFAEVYKIFCTTLNFDLLRDTDSIVHIFPFILLPNAMATPNHCYYVLQYKGFFGTNHVISSSDI